MSHLTMSNTDQIIKPPKEFHINHPYSNGAHLKCLEDYQKLYQESIKNPDEFWGRMANDLITWSRPFTIVHFGGFKNGDIAWFPDGMLNASYNCVDRHAFKNPDDPAIIFEADEPGKHEIITYGELLGQVSQVAATLNAFGVKKGDTVAVYLPMIPQAIITLLAITRIGAIHTVIFAGFSSDSLKNRIIDSKSKIIITSDAAMRGGKIIETKKIVDEALKDCSFTKVVLVFRRIGIDINWINGRDYWWHEEVIKYGPYFPPIDVSAEDPIFLLYTSGSTGAPKGLVHTTAGYLLGAAVTTKYVFDLHKNDILFTAGDIGWITGHTYVLYGPLMLGATTVVFEGTPSYPSFSRYWDIVDQHKVTHFYVAPTALRLLRRAGTHYINHNFSSLRTLGSVGEPISPEVWHWYNNNIGRSKAHICDTYWQTETGSHILAPMAGITPTKPGSASFPVFGIDPVIIDPVTGKELKGNGVEGVLALRTSWPSMARTVWNSHKRYMETYLHPYPGLYFTGDGVSRDKDGFYWILGRIDDVVNVSGHRLSTAEIEAALIKHPEVSESAVIGIHDDLTGQAVMAFVSTKTPHENTNQLCKDLIMHIRKTIGAFAAPKKLIIVNDLPKTRSGKIMRRILRNIISDNVQELGDISTLSNSHVVEDIIKTYNSKYK